MELPWPLPNVLELDKKTTKELEREADKLKRSITVGLAPK